MKRYLKKNLNDINGEIIKAYLDMDEFMIDNAYELSEEEMGELEDIKDLLKEAISKNEDKIEI